MDTNVLLCVSKKSKYKISFLYISKMDLNPCVWKLMTLILQKSDILIALPSETLQFNQGILIQVLKSNTWYFTCDESNSISHNQWRCQNTYQHIVLCLLCWTFSLHKNKLFFVSLLGLPQFSWQAHKESMTTQMI